MPVTVAPENLEKSERMWLILASLFPLMHVFLTTLLAILPSILRSRAAVELENLALRHRRASEVRCETSEINLRRPSLVDLSLPPLARLALSAGHR